MISNVTDTTALVGNVAMVTAVAGIGRVAGRRAGGNTRDPIVFFNYGLTQPFQLTCPRLIGRPMGMFGDASIGILRWQKILRVVPGRTMVVRTSARQLDAVLEQIQDLTQSAGDLIAGHSQTVLTASVQSTSWSVAQCLDHLAQTTNAFLPPISAAIASAPHLTTNRTLRTGALTRLFIRNLEPPYRLRFKVLAPLVPHQHDFDSAWRAFEESQAGLAEIVRSAAGIAIDQARIESPVYARLSYNVYGALRMLMAHQRRHLWQVEQILNAVDAAQAGEAS